MDNLNKLNTEELVDLLSEQTTLYVQMHMEGVSKTEFQKCRLLIEAVQAEIKFRNESKLKQVQ